MALQASEFENSVAQKTYTSFSGSDITVVMGNAVVGTIQAISYSVTREKGPVYTMRGDANPLAFARGKRAIAGTLVFLTIDSSAILQHMETASKNKYWANTGSVRYTYEAAVSATSKTFGIKEEGQTNPYGNGSLASLFGTTPDAGSERISQAADYADQILPFDVSISAANEYGQAMKKTIVAVELLNEGSGVSVDDLVIEEQYTYVCRGITKWQNVKNYRPANS